MAIENFNEVKEYFEQNKDNEEVKGFIGNFKEVPTLDMFKEKIEKDEDFKGYINSLKDSHFSKSLETWKSNNLQKLVDAEMLKKNPSLTPEQLELQNMKKEIENMKKEKARVEMSAKYKDVLNEKKIPSNLTDFLLNNEDEEVINSNITLFEESMKSYIDNMVNERLQQGSYTPPSAENKGNIGLITQEMWDKKKDDLAWYSKNKAKIFESMKKGLIK